MRRWQNRDWAAVWIDQKKAMVVRPGGHNDECEVLQVYSDVESKHKATGGRGKSRPFLHENGPFSAKHFERAREQQLEGYFEEVTDLVKDAEELLILGRGPRALAFSKRFVSSEQQKVHFEKADVLTPNELRKRAFEYFGWVIPRRVLSAPGQPASI